MHTVSSFDNVEHIADLISFGDESASVVA